MKDEERDELPESLRNILSGAGLKVPAAPAKTPVVIEPAEDGDDYVTARVGMHRVMGKIESALDELIPIASQSQHPRAFEVLNQLGKTLIDANKDLLDLKKKQRDLAAGGAPGNSGEAGEGAKTINNTLVVTGADMLDMIRNKLKSQD